MIRQRQGPTVKTIRGFKPNISSAYHQFLPDITTNYHSPYSIYGRNIIGNPIISQPTKDNEHVIDIAMFIKRKEDSHIKGPWPLGNIKEKGV